MIRKAFFRLLAVCILLPRSGSAKTFSDSFEIYISWKHEHAKAMVEQKVLKENWPVICEGLKSKFLSPQTPWGIGVVKKVRCNEPKSNDLSMTTVHLKFSDREKNLTVSKIGHKGVEMGRLDLKNNDKSILMFADSRLKSDLVSFVLDQLPVAMKVDKKNFENKRRRLTVSVSGDAAAGRPLSPPSKIFVYSLEQVGGMWIASVKATGTEGKKRQRKKKSKLHDKKINQVTTRFQWKLDADITEELKLGTLWVHGVEGPGADSKKMVRRIAASVKRIKKDELKNYLTGTSLADLVLKPFKSAYVAARFGWPLLTDAPYADKTYFVGIFADARSGFINGLKFHADIWPSVTEKIGDGVGKFKGSRYIVSWSYRIELPFLKLAIDLTPALGQWNFKIDIPFQESEESIPTPLSFEADKALSLGIGVGTEISGPTYSLRAWYSQDFGKSFVKAIDSSNVESKRLGLDYMHRLGRFELYGTKLLTSVLAFSNMDSIVMSRTSLPDNPDDVTFVESVTYLQVFAGSGFALSW